MQVPSVSPAQVPLLRGEFVPAVELAQLPAVGNGGVPSASGAMSPVGTFSTAQQTFTGKTTRSNCVVDGVVREHEGLAEHLLRPSISDDETGGLDVGAHL